MAEYCIIHFREDERVKRLFVPDKTVRIEASSENRRMTGRNPLIQRTRAARTARSQRLICSSVCYYYRPVLPSETRYIDTRTVTDPTSNPSPDTTASQTEYDQMLKQLDVGIDEIRETIENDNLDDPEREQIRIRQYRTLGYLIRTKRQVLKDKTLEELAKEVAELKEQRDADPVSID